MSGWNLKQGDITEYVVSEDRIWSLFNYVFSDASRKRNSYKFGFIKALLDGLFNGEQCTQGVRYRYEDIFERFTNNYWNLVAKYNLRQMRPDGKSHVSKVEIEIKKVVKNSSVIQYLEFESLYKETRKELVKNISAECKKYVIGALYNDFDGIIYSFNLKNDSLVINQCVYDFMLKYKSTIEKLNYYSWAKFLEQVNSDGVLLRLIDKLELATPHRENLSVYREILRQKFEENTCFYCGKKLIKNIHVDHFILWSFVKDDKAWNFVLACSRCNERKNNKLPDQNLIIKIEDRNKKLQYVDNTVIQADFYGYNDDLLRSIWKYAKLSGLKEFCQ